MNTKFIEAENRSEDDPGGFNWGKFMVAQFTDEEWDRTSAVDGRRLLAGRGWTRHHLLVVDVQTGEGAMLLPGGSARSDLNDKHQIWTCPLFLPFLNWLYAHWNKDITWETLPGKIEFTYNEAPPSMAGQRGRRLSDRML